MDVGKGETGDTTSSRIKEFMKSSSTDVDSCSKRLAEIHGAIEHCKVCPNMYPYLKFPPSSMGKSPRRIMLASEAPGKKSIDSGRYWMGTSGKRLRNILRDSGWKRDLEDLCYLTDVVKCWPRGDRSKNRTPSKREIAECTHYLLDEIAAIQPKIVLACGAISANMLLGKKLKDVAWETLEWKGIRVIAFPHPSSAGRDGDYIGYENKLKDLFRFVIGLNY